jgi:tetratricopeptide (TPR) repeat protein
MLAYLRAAPAWASLALFAAACATKETALTLPAALLLCEAASGRPVDWRAVARRQWMHWALGAALLALALLHGRYARFIDVAFSQRSIADNLLSQAQGVGYLVLRILVPYRLNIDPALPALSAWDGALALQAAGLAALLAIGLISLRARPWLGFGLCWFFLQLLPTNSVVPRIDIANERQLYLALWGLALALAIRLPARAAKAAAIVLALVLVPLGISRQLEYRTEIALWGASVRAAPWNARAYNNLGYARELDGDLDGAVGAYRQALAFDPANETARYNLVQALAKRRPR